MTCRVDANQEPSCAITLSHVLHLVLFLTWSSTSEESSARVLWQWTNPYPTLQYPHFARRTKKVPILRGSYLPTKKYGWSYEKKTPLGLADRRESFYPSLAKCLTSKMEVCVQIHMASIRSTFIISSSISSTVTSGFNNFISFCRMFITSQFNYTFTSFNILLTSPTGQCSFQ